MGDYGAAVTARLPIIDAAGEPPRRASSADLLALPAPAGGVAPTARSFLPTTPAEVQALGWDDVDVVFVTGDAYIDHPSFAMAVLGRVLEAAGSRVAILSQPAWTDVEEFLTFGAPRPTFAMIGISCSSTSTHHKTKSRPLSDS